MLLLLYVYEQRRKKTRKEKDKNRDPAGTKSRRGIPLHIRLNNDTGDTTKNRATICLQRTGN